VRPRLAVLASALTVLATVAVPGLVSAAPRHNRGLTINPVPNPSIAGEGVLIFGQLAGGTSGEKIRLYHRLAGSPFYTRVGTTTTDAHGFYEFTRAEGVVDTNRSWFVRGPGGAHSRTVFERVSALVSLASSATSADTNHPIVFFGHVTPNHAGERVYLQEQLGSSSSDDWRTITTGRIGPGSTYAIIHRFRVPGERDLRVVFPGDFRNIRGESDPVSVTIDQAQLPGFTINSSQPIIDYGHSVTISGVLNTTMPTMVTLYERMPFQDRFVPIQDTTTGAGGSYRFPPQMPPSGALYQVRTTFTPHRHSAVLFEGVRDAVSMAPTSSTVPVDGKVTFTGTVLPDKAGHVIYLQRQGKDGDWHTVEISFVRSNSTFQFVWRFGTPGTEKFRARITSDHLNVGNESAPVTITVVPAPTSTLSQS
jgi:hypothetical protein